MNAKNSFYLMGKGNGEETIIAHGVRMEGDFQSGGNIVIEGEVHGSIKTQGDLRIGDAAVIQATIESANASISGTVEGNLKVNGRLELASSAKITGDISVEVLSIAPGATVNGQVSMKGAVALE
ncbi:MAG: polymer-forming cytoskeletal protein [Patescibacteria group bacterium]